MPTDERNSPDRPHEPRMRTRLIHGLGTSKKWDYDHHVVPPITSSATFRLGSAARGAQGFLEFAHIDAEEAEPHPIYIYDRLAEPTRGMLEENLAYAERGDFGLCFASGMAAISAAIATLARTGENIVAHRVLYGCTYSLFTLWLPRIQIGVKLVDMTDLAALRAAIDQHRLLRDAGEPGPDAHRHCERAGGGGRGQPGTGERRAAGRRAGTHRRG
jgi:O-acetylhomoserine/O-acetylserine sulfhydrylase-like pyridoxal-dependent enzyme